MFAQSEVLLKGGVSPSNLEKSCHQIVSILNWDEKYLEKNHNIAM